MNGFDDLTKDPLSLPRRNSLPASHRHVPNIALTEPCKSSPCDFSGPNLVTYKTFSLYLAENDAETVPFEQTFSNPFKAYGQSVSQHRSSTRIRRSSLVSLNYKTRSTSSSKPLSSLHFASLPTLSSSPRLLSTTHR